MSDAVSSAPTSAATADRLLDRLAPVAASGARAERGRAFLHAHGLPDHHHEAWRYTPVADIVAALESARPAPLDDSKTSSIDRHTVDELAGEHGGPRVVFVNGSLARELSDSDHDAKGVWLGGSEDLAPRRPPGATAPEDEPADGFHALNWAAGTDVAAVIVEPDAQLDTPVHIVHLAVSGDGVTAMHPRTVVRLGPRSRATVIESLVGAGGAPVVNSSTRLLVGEDATLQYHRVVDGPDEAVHVGRVGVVQAARSTLDATATITAGSIVRTGIDDRLVGDGARSNLRGLYLPVARRRYDNVVTVDHAASHGTSTQRFKGIVDDHGRGSFSGHVIVRHGTVGNDASQSNPNLVLSPSAQADTRPWLEIFADDVACTHGATVGRLDDDALFYLRSRGIPAATARSMLVAAFATEILDGIEPPSLRERLLGSLHGLVAEVVP
ncbi:MAG: Fe-S cluster assembly protein SufD [Microthrixaceae bacterium]